MDLRIHLGRFLLLALLVPEALGQTPSPSASNGPVATSVEQRSSGNSSTNTQSVAQKTDFRSFRIISERNIFNQSRGSLSAREERSVARRAPTIRSLALVGTMTYSKGTFAFFNGTSPEFKKSIKAGEKIAGYEVKEIAPASVKLANEKQEIDLKVGEQLRQVDDGQWEVSAAAVTPPPDQDTPRGEPSEDAAPAAAGTVSEDEALKRLMERRAKELKE